MKKRNELEQIEKRLDVLIKLTQANIEAKNIQNEAVVSLIGNKEWKTLGKRIDDVKKAFYRLNNHMSKIKKLEEYYEQSKRKY